MSSLMSVVSSCITVLSSGARRVSSGLRASRSQAAAVPYRTKVAAGAVVIGSLLVCAFVALLVGATDADRAAEAPAAQAGPPAQAPVLAAFGFLTEVTDTDPVRRHRAVARWVSPERMVEFVEAMDDQVGPLAGQAGSLALQPQGWRLYFDEPTVKQVLVWSVVRRTARIAGGESRDLPVHWQVSAIGVHLIGGQWRMFSYEGTKDDVRPGDPRLQGFTMLPGAEVPSPPVRSV